MTQIWDDKGRLVAATLVLAPKNTVLTEASNKVSLIAPKDGRVNKAQEHLAKQVKASNIRVRTVGPMAVEGDSISVESFAVGDRLSITAITKGKGFAGTIKRHNFHRGPMSHGSNQHRKPGSIGAQRPQRVPRGKKMAGQMGSKQLTVRGNKILGLKPAENLLIISGAVPGPTKAELLIKTI